MGVDQAWEGAEIGGGRLLHILTPSSARQGYTGPLRLAF